MADKTDRGRFVWYDLMTTDPKKAEPFYTRVAGWGTQPFEGMPYTMWTRDGAPIGGVGQVEPPGMPPHWLVYIAVPNVDAAVKQAEELGGRTAVPGTDIPNVGRYAVLADPQGAVFAVFTPASAAQTPGPERDPKLGEFSWHELTTTDYKQAFAFYQAMFGWEKGAAEDMGEIGVYLLFRRNGRDIGGMFNMTGDMKVPPNWAVYISVDSADAAAERVKTHGGQVLNGPMDVPGGDRIAQCMDPQGAVFAVHARKK